MATTDWDIAKSTLVCAASGRQFDEDEPIYSALYEEEGEFVRRDYALDQWPPQDVERVFSYWKTRTPKKDAPVRRFVDDKVVFDFFQRLDGRTEPHKVHFRYVIALFLMRRKRLKFVELKRGDDELRMVLHDRVTGSDYEVPDPRLSEEQIQQVSEEVGNILNMKL